MKKLTLYIFLAVFPLTAFYYSQHSDIGPARSISSVSEGPLGCLDTVKNFFKPENNKAVAELRGLISTLSKYSLETRLSTLEFLGKLNIKSNDVRRKYAELLNSAFKSQLINQSELEKLVAEINAKGEWVHIGKNNVVYVDLLEDFANPEDVRFAVAGKFQESFLKLELTQMELQSIKSLPLKLPDEKMEKVISYLSFVRSLKAEDRPVALTHINEIVEGSYPDLPFAKTFQKHQHDIQKFIEEEKSKGISESVALERGKIFEKLTYGCRAKTINVNRLAANKRFVTTMISLELAIGGGSYAYNHHDQEHNLEWYKKFGFDMFLDIGNILISSHITTNPGSDSTYKMIKYYVVGAASSIPPAISYSKMFAHKDADQEKAYNEILQSPEFKSQLAELINYLDKDEEKIRLKELMVPIENNRENEKGLPQDEETRELLGKALARELYEKNQGEWIHTGDVGLDRYVYDRIWGTQSAVRNIAVNLLMYNALCMGELNPKKAYALALTYFIVNKGIFDPTYNYLRRRAINQ